MSSEHVDAAARFTWEETRTTQRSRLRIIFVSLALSTCTLSVTATNAQEHKANYSWAETTTDTMLRGTSNPFVGQWTNTSGSVKLHVYSNRFSTIGENKEDDPMTSENESSKVRTYCWGTIRDEPMDKDDRYFGEFYSHVADRHHPGTFVMRWHPKNTDTLVFDSSYYDSSIELSRKKFDSKLIEMKDTFGLHYIGDSRWKVTKAEDKAGNALKAGQRIRLGGNMTKPDGTTVPLPVKGRYETAASATTFVLVGRPVMKNELEFRSFYGRFYDFGSKEGGSFDFLRDGAELVGSINWDTQKHISFEAKLEEEKLKP